MKYLLDVNVLLAWGWEDHSEHLRARTWIENATSDKKVKLLTSPITELGFIRVSIQAAGGRLSVASAAEALQELLKPLGNRHDFLLDDVRSTGSWPNWCIRAPQTTDAHLAALASKHGAKLATLDASIPGALLIPIPETS